MDFGQVLKFTVKWEGGYVNNPADPGGETKYGISKRSYPNLDIRNLTIEKAEQIYFRDFWVPSGANRLPWPLNLALFDYAVNAGIKRAVKDLQSLVKSVSDGVFGPSTLRAVEKYVAVNGPLVTAVKLCHLRMKLYIGIVQNKITQRIFLSGWTNRVFDLLSDITKV